LKIRPDLDLDTSTHFVIQSRFEMPGGSMEANINTPKLVDVVKQFQEIRVDDYQRTYSWRNEQIDELFEDLKDAASSGENHFFGTLIFETRDNQRATIVDGQQRLTTVFVLVAALRDEISKLSLNEIPAQRPGQLPIHVASKAWSILYPAQDMSHHRFQSNRFLREIFAKGVMPEPPLQGAINERVSEISLAFRKGIKRVRFLVAADLARYEGEIEKLQRINVLLDAMLERFLVLRVISGRLSESLEIFLTLNNRGLPLGPSDLVRGAIMSALGAGETEHQQAKIHQKIFEEWKSVSDLVKEPEAFLRHYLVSTGKEKVQKKKVFESVNERIRDDSTETKKRKASEFWDGVLEAAELYNRIIEPKMGGEMQLHLELLEGLIKSHRVLLLTALAKITNPAELEEIVRATMVLGYRWVMSGGNAQELEDFFQQRSSNLNEGFAVKTVIEAIKEEARIEIDAIEFLSIEGDSSFISRALLFSVNRKLAPDANAQKLDKSLHLEHIAPKTETDDWKRDVFYGRAEEYAEYDALVSEIGNLTLLDSKINIRAQQKLFDEKKKRYNDSVIKMTRDLKEIELWGKEEIKDRTRWLARCFDIIWSVDPASEEIVSFPRWHKQ
jgi:hypothetical protein